jgi:N-acetylneuraminic acid mutarotase
MPTKRQSALAVVENNIIYVIGGANKNGHKLTTVDSYDSATDSWSEEAPLLVGKSKPGGGLLKSTIVAADGTSNSDITGDNEGYDASTNSWTSLAADPDARSATCYGSVGANLYSAAGFDSNLNPINISEAFSLSKNKWTTKASIPQAVIAPGSAVYKGLLYCFGGGSSPDIPIDGVVYNNVQIYQP